jgi:hypothetical protein
MGDHFQLLVLPGSLDAHSSILFLPKTSALVHVRLRQVNSGPPRSGFVCICEAEIIIFWRMVWKSSGDV